VLLDWIVFGGLYVVGAVLAYGSLKFQRLQSIHTSFSDLDELGCRINGLFSWIGVFLVLLASITDNTIFGYQFKTPTDRVRKDGDDSGW